MEAEHQIDSVAVDIGNEIPGIKRVQCVGHRGIGGYCMGHTHGMVSLDGATGRRLWPRMGQVVLLQAWVGCWDCKACVKALLRNCIASASDCLRGNLYTRMDIFRLNT